MSTALLNLNDFPRQQRGHFTRDWFVVCVSVVSNVLSVDTSEHTCHLPNFSKSIDGIEHGLFVFLDSRDGTESLFAVHSNAFDRVIIRYDEGNGQVFLALIAEEQIKRSIC